MPDLTEADLRVFVDAITRYFTQLTREAPRVRGAYLSTGGHALPELEYTGAITLAGAFRGEVYVTAPRALLRHLLVATGESDHSDDSMLDLIGEMANTISGNARRHFGHRLEISVPRSLRAGQVRPPALRHRPYIVSLDWKSYGASVVVDVRKAQDGSAERMIE